MLKVKRIIEKAALPERKSTQAAGLDLFAANDYSLYPGQTIEVSTGVAIELPSGTVGLILDRSSMGRKSITHLAGVIDSDYRGEIIVFLHYLPLMNDNRVYTINKGDRIAQLVILPYIHAEPYDVESLSDTDRNDKAFGSTGV